jgi:hypothetical protein
MTTSDSFINIPSAPTAFVDSVKYPELLSESTNFRLKKIIDCEKLLQDEIKKRNSLYKKYGRLSTCTESIEYALIIGDIGVGALATAIPVVGSVVSAATFSGIGVISGIAKVIQNKLNNKRMKHYKLSTVATTTLNILNRKISKACTDGQISHEEYEDILNTMDEWTKGPISPEKQPALSKETVELLSQQAIEKVQKDLLEQLEQLKKLNNKK